MGNTLNSPKTDKDSEVYKSSTGLVCGGSGMQGWRIEMEDDHIAIDIPSKPDHLLLGVWDGHAGAGAAHYAKEHIVEILEGTDEWKEYLKGGVENQVLVGKAMIATFLVLDEKLRAFQESTNGHDTSGCTSVTAMITPRYIICANAGDSRCVLGTNHEAVPLSFDHKPSLQIERDRITEAGGFVQWNRVDGDLAVSRALGDFGYKTRPDLPPEQQKVSCYPDINVHERNETDDVLLLACDGLWDVMTTSEAVQQIREIYESGESQVDKIAEEMLDISLNKGSKDNISAMVVKLPGAVIGPASNGGVDKRRADRAAAAPPQDAESRMNEGGPRSNAFDAYAALFAAAEMGGMEPGDVLSDILSSVRARQRFDYSDEDAGEDKNEEYDYEEST